MKVQMGRDLAQLPHATHIYPRKTDSYCNHIFFLVSKNMRNTPENSQVPAKSMVSRCFR